MISRLLTSYVSHFKSPKFSIFFSNYATSSAPINPIAIDYLTKSLGLSKAKALSVYQRVPAIKNLENPKLVVQFFKSLGFSDAQIRSSVKVAPQILCSHVDETLKPKIKVFQDLGLSGSDLCEFFAKNSTLLSRSIDKHLIPCIDMLKNVVQNDEDFIMVLKGSDWPFCYAPETVFKANVSYLMECGIVGSQLLMLLRRKHRIFGMNVSKLREYVSKVMDMGFSVNSRMLVHAIHTVNVVTNDKLMKKFQLFRSFGFSEDDCAVLFRKMPVLFRASEEKLKFGLDFYLNTLKFEKIRIIRQPSSLMYSMEDRVVPRYKVLEILKSKKLLKKQPAFMNVLAIAEDVFLDKYISRFPSNAEELLVAYKEHILNHSQK